MSTTDTSREAFKTWHLNKFDVLRPDIFEGGMPQGFRWEAWQAALEWQAATEAAKATGTAGELPPEWISEVCGPDVDGLSYGQGYRRGFNDCRKKVSELQAKLITDEEAWEIIKDEARMQVIDEHGSMAIVIKSPSEAWFIARAILAANNRPSMITAEDCPICKGQSGGIGADGVEDDCHECFRREVQAARQPVPVASQDAETWLRERYGAARGHHAWRDLEEAFKAGQSAALAATAAPVLSDEQISKMERSTIEEAAKAIYQLIPSDGQGSPADHPWQEGGNSNMQDLARRMARAAIAATNRSQP